VCCGLVGTRGYPILSCVRRVCALRSNVHEWVGRAGSDDGSAANHLGNEYHYHVYIPQYDATKYSVLYIRRMMDDYLASPVRGHILSLSCPTRISDI
jgi:hypothetical protein